MALAMNRAFSATLLGSRDSLGWCPRLAVNAAPLALKAHRKPEGLVLRTNQTGRFCITSFLQLRESDLLGLECFRSVASPSSHSSFCEEVFSWVGFVAAFVSNAGRLTQPPLHTNEVDRTNILAPGFRSS